jgi:hypothetical protein
MTVTLLSHGLADVVARIVLNLYVIFCGCTMAIVTILDKIIIWAVMLTRHEPLPHELEEPLSS